MRPLISLLFLFFSATTFGQDKIEGIGKFKLKKTTIAYLDTLVKEKDFDREVIKSYDDYFKIMYKKDKLAELFPDTVKTYNSPPYTHYCKDTRVFYIPKMTISDIEVKDTYLTFYKDTLVNINTDYSSEIVEAFELKYGKAELEKKEKEVKCTLKLTGSTISYTETMFYQYWDNGNIKCTAAIGDYRDSKCEKQSLSYISISIEKISEKIRECDDKEKDRLKNRQNTEKKKQLDDF
ncbi:MAG: hypothetical protein JSS64_06415 [Bacteroidetes bacterium]|nr:hypothetical protein [Bacteroidota bacterium]